MADGLIKLIINGSRGIRLIIHGSPLNKAYFYMAAG